MAPRPRTFAHRVCGNGAGGMTQDITALRKRLSAAKWRCEHATEANRSYAGIAFEFPSPAIGARLLLGKLGPLPPGKSLDRIDPRGPYSLENLRYATPLLQVLN